VSSSARFDLLGSVTNTFNLNDLTEFVLQFPLFAQGAGDLTRPIC
jgi:hypothetical protein